MNHAPRRWFNEARVAMMLLTRVPVGRLSDPVPSLADARWAYPLVGLVVGGFGWAAQSGAMALGLPQLPVALVAFGAMALLTGGLHHDGLADFADGIGGGHDKIHCLEIMRDSRIGSYGVLALIFVIGLSASALSAFENGAPLALFLALAVGSRLAMLMVLDLLPPARDDGLGQSASRRAYAAWLPGISVVVIIGMLSDVPLWSLILGGAVVAAYIAWCAQQRIGGQTGDVLGAAQLSSETTAWLLAAAFLAM